MPQQPSDSTNWPDDPAYLNNPSYLAEMLSFVKGAAAAAFSASPEHKDDTFEVVLGALLQDWVENWSSDDDAPPADDAEQARDVPFVWP